VHELSRGAITDFQVGAVWHGAGELEFGASDFDEIDALAPTAVSDGWVLSMAFSVTGGSVVPLDSAAADGAAS